MNRRDFMQQTISALASLAFSYSGVCEGANSVGIEPRVIAENANRITVQRNSNQKKYTQIEWLLYKDKEKIIYGKNPNPQNLESLEELVFTDKDPASIELTEWEITTLAKLVPLKRLIEIHANYYSNDPMWATMFFTFESSLKPTDYNRMSNDFGLGQIKRDSEKLAKKLGTNLRSVFYSPYLRKDGIIFDPETNIIMAMLLHRHNIERYHLKNSDQVYAVYVRGIAGLNRDKSLNSLTKEKLDAFRGRYNYFQNIISLFRLGKDKIANIQNKDTRTLLEIYYNNPDVMGIYRKELDYFLNDLEKNLKGDARSVLVYDDCVTFASTLQMVWNIDQINNYRRLLVTGKQLLKLVTNNELKGMVVKTTNTLIELSQNRFYR